MAIKINSNLLPIPLVTHEATQGVDPTDPSKVRHARENLGIGKIGDTFEQFETGSDLNMSVPSDQFQPGDSYSVNDLRMLVSAAKAENKPPFSVANLNRLLAASINNYTEIGADLKGWINKNFYLTPRQKAPLDAMSEEDLKKVQDATRTATELGKSIIVEIQNQPGNLNKVLELKNQEIGDHLKLLWSKVPKDIADQKVKETAQDVQVG